MGFLLIFPRSSRGGPGRPQARQPRPPPALEALRTSSLSPSMGPGTLFWVPVSQDPQLLGSRQCVSPLGLSLSGTPSSPRLEGAPGLRLPPQGRQGPPASTSRGGDEARAVGASSWGPACRARGGWVRTGLSIRVCGSELQGCVWAWPGYPFSQRPWETAAIPVKSSPQLQSQPGLAWHPHLPHWLHVDPQDRWFKWPDPL